jgi:hypothetical protein
MRNGKVRPKSAVLDTARWAVGSGLLIVDRSSFVFTGSKSVIAGVFPV